MLSFWNTEGSHLPMVLRTLKESIQEDKNGQDIQEMRRPPNVLCSKRASPKFISPLPFRLIKPDAEKTRVSSIVSHHASDGNLSDTGNPRGSNRADFASLVPSLHLPRAVTRPFAM